MLLSKGTRWIEDVFSVNCHNCLLYVTMSKFKEVPDFPSCSWTQIVVIYYQPHCHHDVLKSPNILKSAVCQEPMVSADHIARQLARRSTPRATEDSTRPPTSPKFHPKGMSCPCVMINVTAKGNRAHTICTVTSVAVIFKSAVRNISTCSLHQRHRHAFLSTPRRRKLGHTGTQPRRSQGRRSTRP